MVSGTGFNGHADVQRLLKTQENKLARNLIESLAGYAIGRPIEFSDQGNIDEILESVEAKNYALKDMIYLITNSPTFRSK